MRAVVRQRLPDRPVHQGRHQPTNGWYGGTLPKRLRFLVEVTEAVTRAWSPDRVGVRLSPVADYNDMKDRKWGAALAVLFIGAEILGRFYLVATGVAPSRGTDLIKILVGGAIAFAIIVYIWSQWEWFDGHPTQGKS